jgi:hypothetical protein
MCVYLRLPLLLGTLGKIQHQPSTGARTRAWRAMKVTGTFRLRSTPVVRLDDFKWILEVAYLSLTIDAR